MPIHNAKVGDSFSDKKNEPKKNIGMKVKMRVPVPPATIIEQAEQKVTKSKDKKPHNLDGKFIHVKVGDPSWQDMNLLQFEMDKVESKIKDLFEENDIDCTVFVTHWAVDMKLIEAQEKKKGNIKAL